MGICFMKYCQFAVIFCNALVHQERSIQIYARSLLKRQHKPFDKKRLEHDFSDFIHNTLCIYMSEHMSEQTPNRTHTEVATLQMSLQDCNDHLFECPALTVIKKLLLPPEPDERNTLYERP